jgi:hypothetical protein
VFHTTANQNQRQNIIEVLERHGDVSTFGFPSFITLTMLSPLVFITRLAQSIASSVQAVFSLRCEPHHLLLSNLP